MRVSDPAVTGRVLQMEAQGGGQGAPLWTHGKLPATLVSGVKILNKPPHEVMTRGG